jgi:hypothetical protein
MGKGAKALMRAAGALFAIVLLALSISGCASAPAKKSDDDCLVIIMTETINPSRVEEARHYEFSFTGTAPTVRVKPHFTPVLLHEPGVQIAAISSWVQGDNVRGSKSNDKTELLLPYAPGKLVIADFVFVQTYKQENNRTISCGVKLRQISPEEKGKLIAYLKADAGYAPWFE